MTELTADELRVVWTDDRVGDLLDSAEEHLLNKRPDRAIATWQRLISEGGEDGDWGRFAYAEYLFQCDREEEGRDELFQLMLGRRVLGDPWRLTAGLFEDFGELEYALFWYSAAVRHLSAQGLDDASEPYWAHELRAGRRRLRWALEIPLDDDDLRAPTSEDEGTDKESIVTDLLVEPEVIDGRLQFWAREDFAKTHRLCSRLKTQDAETPYYRGVESVLRAAEGGRRIQVVPRTFESWIRLLDVADPARRPAEVPLLTSRYDEGRAIEWPPGRNQLCWCGSGAKYKKCCGLLGDTV